ncbi:hypothetical protein [Haloarcula argentinensis]|nr:hypothetical protein [Haloarcula argentinensis]MDS0254443.1 hypothetical protein [Haloarcula argentinensis]
MPSAYVEGMGSEIAVEAATADEVSELRRALRDNQHVDLVATNAETVELSVERHGLRELTRTLLVRERSARKFGQAALAAADRSVRTRLQKAV